MEQKKYTYDAFISYRHTDLDKFVAETLHKKLESFKLPKNVIKNTKTKKTSIKRVFRDKDELPITNNLEDPLIKALSESEFLIVICSPRIKESEWCRREIQNFIEMHGRENVLAVLIEGEPEDSFPTELLVGEEVVENADGTTSIVEKHYEPLAADFRGKNKKEIQKAMDREILRLIAPMLGLNYDDLRQRHREQKIRKRVFYVATIGSLGVLFGLYSTIMALTLRDQKAQIEEQTDLLRTQQAKNLVNEARELYNQGDRKEAVELCYESMTFYEGIEMPKTSDSFMALAEILGVYEAGNTIKPVEKIEAPGTIKSAKLSPNKDRLFAVDDLDNVFVWDVNTREKLVEKDNKSLVCFCDFIDNDNIVFSTVDKGIVKVNISTNEEKCIKPNSDDAYSYITKVAMTSDKKRIIAIGMARCFIIDVDSLSIEKTVECDMNYVTELTISQNDEYALFLGEGIDTARFYCVDLVTGEMKYTYDVDADFQKIYSCVSDKDTAYLLISGFDNFILEDTTLIAINNEDGSVKYINEHNSFSSQGIYLFRYNNIPYLFAWDSHQLILIEGETGNIKSIYNIEGCNEENISFSDNQICIYDEKGGSNIIFCDNNFDLFALSTFEITKMRQLLVGDNKILCYQRDGNRLLYFGRIAGKRIEEYDKDDYESGKGEESSLSREECIEWAEENGVAKANYVNCFIEVPDSDLTLVMYRDEKMKVYKSSTMELLESYENCGNGKFSYLGKCGGYNVAANTNIGFLLNDKGEMVARIKNFKGIDGDNLIVSGKNSEGNYADFKIPVYSEEELLEEAREFLGKQE